MTTGRIVARDGLLAGTGLYQSKMLLQPVCKKLFEKHIRQTAKKQINTCIFLQPSFEKHTRQTNKKMQ
jgi:hypothetical protein